ncbi:MAG TPA: efflux RND transporter periplasmic adaptor subunit [Phycisphaerales bacterium]|nr:efflux RND transporter periplasmic adaptor subunit [Phycisphaerales bacterium]
MFRLLLMMIVLFAYSLTGCSRSGEAPTEHDEADDHDHAHEGEAAHTDEVVLTAQAIEHYGLKTEAVRLWQLLPTFMAPARIGFNTEAIAHVGSPLSGRVVELKVRLGDNVLAGDPLVVVESPELGTAQSDFLIKRTAVDTAAPAVDLARATWDRARNLFESTQGLTLTEVQQREAEYKAASAALKSAEVEAVAAENRLHLLGMSQEQVETLARSGEVNPRSTLAAPIAGEVVLREVTLGELVHPEREALIVLADMTSLWALAEVPEARIQEVRLGATAWINAGELDPHRHEGQVSYIAPAIDPKTRTATVRVVVECNDRSLKPGNFVQIELVGSMPADGEPQPVLAVPESAIQTVEGDTAVFVPVDGEPNTFAKRKVTIGQPVGGLVPIMTGLVEGEHFVSAGSFILKAELGKSAAEHSH